MQLETQSFMTCKPFATPTDPDESTTKTITTTTFQIALFSGGQRVSQDEESTPQSSYDVDVDEDKGIMIHTNFSYSEPCTTGPWIRLRIQNTKEEERDVLISRLARTTLVNEQQSTPSMVQSVAEFISRATAVLETPSTGHHADSPSVELRWSFTRFTESCAEEEELEDEFDAAENFELIEFRIPLNRWSGKNMAESRELLRQGVNVALQLLSDHQTCSQ
ncbi:hypothetical protein F5878DRAFT_608448 [Lentinula raphanica]|uniref:Uncharacterized protein n=1 Tax=Lentinula raphanica TaxID=153919 RepID=A0AA38PFY6_9AGAR|nr:hypothetical protein F5878DRAFT_608448 [Lentinula raphanica]